jgi:pyridoxine/pyridoxamine 5'-phosphate oxidase
LLSQLHSRGGFLFVTNYESDKGKQLAKNPHCALNFLWPELERSVRVSGTAYRVPAALSDMYHEQRPRSSRVAALTSEQSRPVASRASLEERYTALDQQLRAAVPPEGRAADEYVPRPASWGAYVVVPHRMEVWQGRGGRFHARAGPGARRGGALGGALPAAIGSPRPRRRQPIPASAMECPLIEGLVRASCVSCSSPARTGRSRHTDSPASPWCCIALAWG